MNSFYSIHSRFWNLSLALALSFGFTSCVKKKASTASIKSEQGICTIDQIDGCSDDQLMELDNNLQLEIGDLTNKIAAGEQQLIAMNTQGPKLPSAGPGESPIGPMDPSAGSEDQA